MAKQEVAATGGMNIPAHLQGGKTAKIGNVDSTDLIIPRVKLLQGISPEVTAHDAAKAGEFWHTIAGVSLGKSLVGIPILTHKSFVLWSPRNDERGILARADDGVHWDAPAGTTFSVKPKGAVHPVEYVLGSTVNERTGDGPALSEFGSSLPGDPKSPPAAALTYQFLWYFPDFPDMSPAIIINTRSSVKAAMLLLSKIDHSPVDHYGQKYTITVTNEKSADGPYFGYSYVASGFASEAEYEITHHLYEKLSKTQWRANDEGTTEEDIGNSGGRPKTRVDDKDIPF